MDSERISQRLQPFLTTPLSPEQLSYISIYIDLLLRWNDRVNLTAIRKPEEIVSRHFGESLFVARHLFPTPPRNTLTAAARLIDIGSGAGFPGLAIKIWSPDLHATLIESNHKKATFLREAIRSLTLTNVDVYAERAEDFPTAAELVTLRAVERFELILPTAERLVSAKGRLALLIGTAQAARARELTPKLLWLEPIPIPLSSNRVLLIGRRSLQ